MLARVKHLPTDAGFVHPQVQWGHGWMKPSSRQVCFNVALWLFGWMMGLGRLGKQ